MTPDSTLPTVPLCAGFAPTRPSTLACAALLSALLPLAQAQPPTAPLPVPSATSVPLRSSAEGWQVCQTQKADPVTQLACFQAWAAAQTTTASASPQRHHSGR